MLRRRLIAAVLLLLGIAAVWLGSPPLGAAHAAAPGASVADLPVVLPRASCASLAGVDLTAIGGTGSRVASAVAASGAEGHAVCAVTGTLAPAITFRIELPTRSWTQRYLQTGCGGLCGRLGIDIGAADGCPTVAAGGFAVASTDMGHEGRDGSFGRNPQARADFAYRGVHLTALAARALTRAFYGQPARYRYFSGCSDGGREALVEAQRFPGDFDGIVAGAPAMNFVVQNSLYHSWQARANTGPDGKAILTASRLPLLHAAVVAACDGLDGRVDGLIATPGRCRFDPLTLVCRPGEAPARCLTPVEAMVARRFYDGPRDPVSGERLTQGGPQYGSELEWAGVYVPPAPDAPIFSALIARDSMATLIFPDGKPVTVGDVTFDRATFDRLQARHTLFDATDPDLAAFAEHGGKLILFHGWADPHISPLNTIAYHQAVLRQLGAARTAGFERLYLMPGMSHCSGGEGPSAFDLLTPVMAWVERGIAPQAILTRSQTQSRFGQPPSLSAPAGGASAPRRSRPVYPYPFIAAYRGSGNPDDAGSWSQGEAVPVAVPTWAGSGFYAPYAGVTD